MGYVYNEAKMRANIMNIFFIQTIVNIRKDFLNNIADPLIFLKNLKPRVTQNCILPLTTIKEVIKYIDELKASNTTGHDLFNYKMLKKG